MPQLDVTDVLLDPDFADKISVIRRAEAINPANGRSELTPTTIPDIIAVVTMATPDDLARFDVGQIQGQAIWLGSLFRFRAAKEGQQPDQVVWDGVTYTIRAIQPYTRFGAGFVEAIALSMNASNANHE